MAAKAERRASVVWEGALTTGHGRVTTNSGVLKEQGITWEARTEGEGGKDKTSPEELIAAAHASCYAMAFSHTLAQGGNPADRLDVEAVVTFDPKEGGGFAIGSSSLTVRGRVPGLDQAAFAQTARTAEQNCPVSNALRNNVVINLDATLETA